MNVRPGPTFQPTVSLRTTGLVARCGRPAITERPDQPSSSRSMARLVASGGRTVAHIAGSRPAWTRARQSPCASRLVRCAKSHRPPSPSYVPAARRQPGARFTRVAQLGSTRLCRRTDAPRAYGEPVVRRTSARFRVSGHENSQRQGSSVRPRTSAHRAQGILVVENAVGHAGLDDGLRARAVSVAAPATCPGALRARIGLCRSPTRSPYR